MSHVQLPRSTPEAEGLASIAVLAFLDAAEQTVQHLHSLMLLRHGVVIAEGWWAPYAAERPHMLFSLSKSFTALAIGLAVEEGLVSLDDAVLAFFPDDAPPEVSPQLAAMQIRHLLSMATGHAEDTTATLQQSADGNWVRAFLACQVQYAPGTHFLYNTGATYMLSAILQRVSGRTLLEYLEPRLLAPLGIVGATWERCPRGISIGGYGLSTTTEAVARFGQLLLQRGMWQGRQLVPQGWIDAATAAQISNGSDPNSDWAQGYGYQFWRCRHGAYRGDGAFGQFCVVLPEQHAVLAITGGLAEMQPVLDLVWTHLLPAFDSAALPLDEQTHAKLKQRLAALRLPLPGGTAEGREAEPFGERGYRCEPNDLGLAAIRLHFDSHACTLTFRDASGEHSIVVGAEQWHAGRTSLLAQGSSQPIAAAGAWLGKGLYQAQILYIETPFCVTLAFRLSEEQLVLAVTVNVSFGPTSYPPIVGHRATDDRV
jgi:CubicO group peptidase (beta-lactamase class C family)